MSPAQVAASVPLDFAVRDPFELLHECSERFHEGVVRVESPSASLHAQQPELPERSDVSVDAALSVDSRQIGKGLLGPATIWFGDKACEQ